VPPGELNPGGYYQSPAELTHAWDGNPGGFSRGQALYYGYVARQRFHQYLVQEKFQKTWLRRFGRLFVLSLLVSGLINIFLIEGENKDLPYTGHSSLHVRIAAHMMKANPEVMAALGPFIIDFPESLFVSQFRNGHAGFVFAVIGTRARGIVTIELVRNNRFSSVWRVADFSLDLLDGTCVEVMPIGSLFSSVEHKARIKEMFELKRVRQNDGTETTNQLLRQKVETEEEYAQKKRDVQKKASEIERQFNRSQMRELCGLQEDGFNGFMSAADTSQTLLGISNNSKIQK
jgi:hypothetical protein